jgi:4-hydroxy-2-oxoheptanedioate aldolase
MVNSRAQALEAVESTRYPPLGERSYGPIRSRMHLGTDPAWVNEQVMVFVQIETTSAMTALDEILSVPGIDGVYVGPADLALSHGLPVGAPSAGLDALHQTIIRACATHGVLPGVHTLSGEDARRAFDAGYVLASVGTDAVWLRGGYAQQVAAVRATMTEVTGDLY